ncbi:hypothetical protein B296_00015069 [Ensete ventricosum]|uniref:Uncharacterized protein n=1 Tax=Ensete ventricosum TaxID=4639 RepID=A0A427B742_ENSVE|nr:hypothetical protein B296_00015069 [Ensete ventricosum]
MTPYPNGFSVSIDALEAGLRFSLHPVIEESVSFGGGLANDDIDLLLERSLQVRRGVLGITAFRGFVQSPDIATKVLLTNEVLNLVPKVVTLLGVMTVVTMEAIVSCFIPHFQMGLHQVGIPEEPFLSNLEEDFGSGGIERNQWQPRWGQFGSVPTLPRRPRCLSSGLLCAGALLVLAFSGQQGLGDDVLGSLGFRLRSVRQTKPGARHPSGSTPGVTRQLVLSRHWLESSARIPWRVGRRMRLRIASVGYTTSEQGPAGLLGRLGTSWRLRYHRGPFELGKLRRAQLGLGCHHRP